MACGRVEPQSKALADARTNFCRCSVLQMQLVHNPGELGFKSFGNFPFERLDASKRRRKNMFTMIQICVAHNQISNEDVIGELSCECVCVCVTRCDSHSVNHSFHS